MLAQKGRSHFQFCVYALFETVSYSLVMNNKESQNTSLGKFLSTLKRSKSQNRCHSILIQAVHYDLYQIC